MIEAKAKRVKSRNTAVNVIKKIRLQDIALCIMSYFVGRVGLFDNFYTLSVAYVGAMMWGKGISRISAMLALLGIMSINGINFVSLKYICMILMIVALRELMNLLKCRSNMQNQLLILGLTVASISAMTLSIDGFTPYKLMLVILETAVAMGLMSILNVGLNVITSEQQNILNEYEVASIAFLIAVFLCGMVDISIKLPYVEQIYLKDILVFVILIGSTYLGGMQAGVVVSVIISSVLVIIGYIPTNYVGVYMLVGLMGGLFKNLERLGIIFATTLGLLLGFTIFNDKVIDLPILGSYLIATIISLIIPKDYFNMANWFEQNVQSEDANHLQHVQAIISERLKQYSLAFASLGKEFKTISFRNPELDQKRLNQMIEDTGESVCQKCSKCEYCWDTALQHTYAYSYKMADKIYEKGHLSVYDIPAEFRKICLNPEGFAFALGVGMESFKKEIRWQKQFDEARSLISEDFKGISDSIKGLVRDIDEDFEFNRSTEQRLKMTLQTYGVHSKDVIVLEKKEKLNSIHLYCYYHGDTTIKDTVVKAVEETLEKEVEIERYTFNLEERSCYFQIVLKRRYKLDISAKHKAKDGKCGDAYTFMELEDGKCLIALADGMGSGEVAHQESESAIELLESFLTAGFPNDSALRIINSALILKSDIECYTTLDMALFDEYTGSMQFWKMGASTSFIIRNNKIIPVQSDSLPIGMLGEVNAIKLHKQLRHNDIIIMVTDGMLEARNGINNEDTFCYFIEEAISTNITSPDVLTRFLIDKVKNLMANQENDDMTIVVAKVQ